MNNYIKLLSFLKEQKRLFGLAIVTMFIASSLEGFQLSLLVPLMDRIFTKKTIVVPNQLPDFIERLIAHLNTISPETLFHFLPFVALGMILIKHTFAYAYQYLMNDVSQRVMMDVRYRLYEKIQSLSLDYFSAKRTGELLSRITHDVNVIETAVSYGVTDLFRQSFLILIYVTIAFSIHFKAACIIFFVFPLIIWPITVIGRKLRKLARSSQERMADINSILLETISGIKVVKAFCTEKYELKRFQANNHAFYRLKMKTVKRLLMTGPITEVFGVICGVIMILWLGRQVMDGTLSLGMFTLFFGSIMQIISPVKKLGNVNALTQQGLAANTRIYEILDQQPSVKEKEECTDLPVIHKGIRLEDVHFRYTPDNPEVLSGIRLDIEAGQLVAIVGPTGTGKSTLANLIPRFYDPTSGRVTIDGIDVKEVSFKSLRSQIGIVAQETFLFNETVASNIAYGCPEASQGQIEDAAHKAYAHRFITRMPEQYRTVIGDRGFRLSGGEKQRVAIARAILKNPPILILDEATSALDSESEKYVQEALDTLMEGRTVIAIAHRLSTIKKADKIVVLDQGQIVGLGPHAELLETCPLYKRLHDTQFQL